MKNLILLILSLLAFNAHAADKIVGQWKTIDDETNKPKSIVEIYEKEGTYYGKIVKLFREPTEDQNPKCDKCSGDKKDKLILGMQILTGLKKDSETKWVDGDILDPKNGKTYSCKAEVIEDGKKLKLRGFIGISLLGRTQTWEAYTEPVAAPAAAATTLAPAVAPVAPQAVVPEAKSPMPITK